MMVANLTVVAVLALAQGPDASDLVARLGSARYADREAAAAALEKLGAAALPALREGLNSRDAEIRTRSSALLEKIDADLMTRPTLVRLDFEDQPIDEVIKALNTQTPFAVVLEPENAGLWKARKVTIHESEPVPFWKAIDRLSQAAGLQQLPGPPMMIQGQRPSFRLSPGTSQVFPTSDSGPFRVTLQSVHLHRDLSLASLPQFAPGQVLPQAAPPAMPAAAPPAGVNAPRPARVAALPKAQGGPAAARPPVVLPIPPNPVPAAVAIEEARPAHAPIARLSNEQFYVQLHVMSEPRLSLAQSQDLRLIEAVDDRGQSLLQPNAGRQVQRFSGYSGYSTGAFLQLPVHLRLPEQPGTAIKRLRGVIPVAVSARKPEPVEIPLKREAAGKPVRAGDMNITVHEVAVDPNNQQTTIDVSLTQAGAAPDGAFRGDFGGFRMPNTGQNQLEVVDEKGKTLSAITQTTHIQADEVRMTLRLQPGQDGGNPAKLHYYNLTRTIAEVPFEFTDVPIP